MGAREAFFDVEINARRRTGPRERNGPAPGGMTLLVPPEAFKVEMPAWRKRQGCRNLFSIDIDSRWCADLGSAITAPSRASIGDRETGRAPAQRSRGRKHGWQTYPRREVATASG